MHPIPASGSRCHRAGRAGFALFAVSAVFAAFAVFAFGASAALAQDPATRIIDHFVFEQALLNKPGTRRSSVEFESKPALGPVWVILNYIGRPTGSTADAVTSFEVIPEGVAVAPGQTYLLFQASRMANYEVDDRIILQVAGRPPRVFTARELRPYMSAEDYAAYMAGIEAERKRTKDWVQLLQMQRYIIPETEPGQIHVSLRTLEKMQPLSLEVLIGQGPLPEAAKAFAERRNRSWIHRNQNFLYMIGTALALAFLAFRFLRSR